MIDRSILALEPPESVEDNKTILKAYKKFNGLRGQYYLAVDEVAKLEAAVKEAERVDRQAFGEALAAGKKDPGATAVVEAKAALEDGLRRRDALEHAVKTTYPEVQAAVVETRDQWREEMAEQFQKAAEDYEKAVTELADSHAWFADVITTLSWLEKFASGGQARRKKNVGAARLSELRYLTGPNGDPYSVDAVFRALRDLGDLHRLAGRADD